MAEILSVILKILFIVFFFGFCVFIHEFGHLLVALWKGLHVEKFSVGMGPKLWGFTYKGVEYVISWLPFGGYVSLPPLAPPPPPPPPHPPPPPPRPPPAHAPGPPLPAPSSMSSSASSWPPSCGGWACGAPPPPPR